MRISLSTDSFKATKTDFLALSAGTANVAKDPALAALAKAMGGTALADAIKDEGFTGKPGQLLKLQARGRVDARWVLVVGVGKDAGKAAAARLLGHHVAKASKRQRSASLVLPVESAEAVRQAAEGLIGGSYRYSTYFTGSRKPKGGLKTAALLVSDKKDAALKAGLTAGRAVGESVNVARDLVNAPPNDLTPPALAEFAATEAEKLGVSATVWGKKQIEKAGMHLLMAVNRGSSLEPRFVHMAWEPEGATRKVVFVGKGLTFDSGGLCLKPAKSMIDMKCDMAGAAITVGIVLAAARMKLPVAVHAIVAATENMGGADAYRPGDIFSSLDGKTVEIINTDAEGRLVLADALAYARELGGDFLIDHATLTGACMVALGHWRAGLFSSDDELTESYLQAAEASGEAYWRMPMDEQLRSTLESPVADLKHTGTPYGGSVTAALFLSEFVGKSRFMHVDVAGPSFLDSAHGFLPQGGTGFGVGTAIRFLEGLADSQA
ncbi:MAG: leucyl aminopeptidase [Deltaproteobacteria bacterium]|nr:leucyl aminopeptidase [Deltaproteobacteria bacterium]